jgi:hypothetical protein
VVARMRDDRINLAKVDVRTTGHDVTNPAYAPQARPCRRRFDSDSGKSRA